MTVRSYINKDGISYLTKALYAQERVNIVRQLRNEAAYQSLRNGFLILLFALIMSVVSLGNTYNSSDKNDIETSQPTKAVDNGLPETLINTDETTKEKPKATK